MEFRAASIDWMDRISILACELDRSSGKIAYIAKPVEFVMAPHTGTMIQNGTMELDATAARSLMNALWEAGVRPSNFKNQSGEINRLETHLADMRRLVFATGGEPQNGEGTK
jgi:hypothetical protein